MSRLHELLEERERRRRKALERAAAKAADEWAAERASVNPENLSAGELANMFEGLTPSGKDRQGRQVSFVERGIEVLGRRRRISWPPMRIS